MESRIWKKLKAQRFNPGAPRLTPDSSRSFFVMHRTADIADDADTGEKSRRDGNQ
jgi:hypothetical protein